MLPDGHFGIHMTKQVALALASSRLLHQDVYACLHILLEIKHVEYHSYIVKRTSVYLRNSHQIVRNIISFSRTRFKVVTHLNAAPTALNRHIAVAVDLGDHVRMLASVRHIVAD